MTTISSPVTSRSDGAAVAITVDGPADGPVEAPTRDIALLARRLAARCIDMFTVLFMTLALVLLGLAPVMNSISSRWAPEPWGRALAATILYTLVSTVYEVSFLGLRGQTPGKDICHVRVVDLATGQRPSFGQALIRTLPFAVLRLCPGVALATAAPILFGLPALVTSAGRSLPDLAARTMVIRREPDPEDGELVRIDRDDLARTYGPRSLRDFINRRLERR